MCSALTYCTALYLTRVLRGRGPRPAPPAARPVSADLSGHRGTSVVGRRPVAPSDRLQYNIVSRVQLGSTVGVQTTDSTYSRRASSIKHHVCTVVQHEHTAHTARAKPKAACCAFRRVVYRNALKCASTDPSCVFAPQSDGATDGSAAFPPRRLPVATPSERDLRRDHWARP